MPVNRNERTYPLVLKTDPLNTGIESAFDWAAEDASLTASNGKDHSGNLRHFTAPTTEPTIVQTTGGKGRDTSLARTSASNFYQAEHPGIIGLAVGTGDFTIHMRIRTPSFEPTGTVLRQIGRLADSGGQKIQFQLYEVLSTKGWHWQITTNGATNILVWNSTGNPALPLNTITSLHITRIAGQFKCYVDGVLKTTTTPAVVDLLATAAATKTIMGGYTANQFTDAILLDTMNWSRGLTDAEVSAHHANPYAYYNNTAAADSVTVTSPATGATVSAAGFTVAGTFAGGTSITSVQASFNAGAFVTIATSPTGGTFTGNMTGQTAGTGTLTVRTMNGTTVVASTTVASVTVAADSIAFTVPATTVDGAVPYRLFQRNALNQAAVRVTGTYTGTPTAIQYRWNAGTWTTLVTTPAGGVFDQTVTLQGPGQGDFELRFSNNVGITTKLLQIGVGDLFIVGGQSNHVGQSLTAYKPAVAPTNNPTWQSVKLAKNGVWKPHLEQSDSTFDDRTGATYTVQTGGTPGGSYFGALATRLMATGVPVGFVPCALGSTSITAWAVNTATTSLYGAMLARATQIGAHKGVLWWQGENEASGTSTQAQHETALNALVNDWFTRTGRKWYVFAINAAGTGGNFAAINAAIVAVGQTNPNCAGWANFNGSFTGDIHYDAVTEIDELSLRAFNAIQGIATASFTSLRLGNNTATGHPAGTSVVWEWHQNGRLGGTATSVTYGSGTLNSDGRIVAIGLPSGTGYLIGSIRGAGYATDSPFYQPGTAV